MVRHIIAFACALNMAVELRANCENVHCRFEYLGHHGVEEFGRRDFMNSSATSAVCNRHFFRESIPFRELNWRLACLEKSASAGNRVEMSNAVFSVARLIDRYENFFRDGNTGSCRAFPVRLRMLLLERIEYSMARMALGRGRACVVEFLDALLPDSVIDAGRVLPAWHSIKTFKQMLFIACAIEDYSNAEGCCPLNLDVIKLPETKRKCACGRDIEYEHHDSIWVLRSRCESYDGGLRFDEYIPMVYSQRKRLDLCLSPTFNEKRRLLFCGEDMNTTDIRLTGKVFHDKSQSGVHIVKFTNPSAGCSRIVPLSEQNGDVKSQSEDGDAE